MGVQDFIAIGIAVAAALWILRRFTKALDGEGGCGCSKTKSNSSEVSCGAKPRTGVKRRPFVPLESVGRPLPSTPNEPDETRNR